MNSVGKVYLVGAGPGDPGLITLRGVECLNAADLVLYDGLVNPLLLRHTRGATERTARTRRGGLHVPQNAVNERMISAAREGLTVVRLKGGDPFIFGRGGEEAAALTAEGIPFEVVPGITAATAAAVCTGISLTHRDFASAVTFITGHEEHSRSESKLDYAALARISGTLVFYMGLDRVDLIAKQLIASGKPAATRAAVVCQATLPGQRFVTGPLDAIAALVREAGLHAPSLIIVGDVVGARQPADWFTDKPLRGTSIGIARAEDQLTPVISKVNSLGGEPVLMPLIDIAPPGSWEQVDAAISRLAEYDWILFTSVNGVRGLMSRLWQQGGDSRWLGRLRIAVIGPATRDALTEFGLRADLMPDGYRAECLAESLAGRVHGNRLLWARANRGRDVLPRELAAAGAVLDQVVVYRNQDVDRLPPDVEVRLQEGRLDWIALSSPSIARGVARVTAGLRQSGSLPRFAAISPVTAEAAAEAGLQVEVIAEDYTWDGLLAVIAGSPKGRTD
ncbi:Uroporphyrinogen-III C-methyltransferase [Caulifigura coniformis]|uniref:uroporphyrinogen-III C-methyltransferase n=1 Tax=Caulifigura coniformis TaxID=2527983 RepID=A0A517SFU5_9PLAN|nr:uroporphyrinogen-III C-methyltransferase [Caulifigura coniformis]QDT54994.1 Uroporphyrinogen-III C-methyltransferase [Caulifigura coniformis]